MRLFVAVWPSEDVVEALRRLPRPSGGGGGSGGGRGGIRWTTPQQWHVTLQFLGEVGEDQAKAAAAEWRAVAATHAPRTVHAGPATTCFGRSILVVPVAGLDDLGRGHGPDNGGGERFTGHLTLARSRQRNLRPLAGEPFDASWLVDELTLVRSRTLPDGAAYEVIERWPLSDGKGVVDEMEERW